MGFPVFNTYLHREPTYLDAHFSIPPAIKAHHVAMASHLKFQTHQLEPPLRIHSTIASCNCFILSIFLVLSFCSFDVSLAAARRLLDTAPPSLPTIPVMPTLPPLPSSLPTLPNTALPPLPSVPTLPQPALPSLPKTTLPPLPSLPTMPSIPSMPKLTLPPQRSIPAIPTIPTTLPSIPFLSPPPATTSP